MDYSGHQATHTQSTATGNAIQHNGNVYGNVTNNYGNRDDTTRCDVVGLPYAKEAAFDSLSRENDPLCLENTRMEVLQRIRAWTYGEEDSCIFWLNGMAGTGKSTIARTLAHEFRQKKELGASFFFVRGGGEIAHAGLFYTTIATQLASTSSELKQHISSAIHQHPDITSKSKTDQWDRLIVQPLNSTRERTVVGKRERLRRALKFNNKARKDSRPPVLAIIVDAIDECHGEADVQNLVATMARAKNVFNVRLRVILTSRPERSVTAVFQRPEIAHFTLELHNEPRETVDADIRLFLSRSFQMLTQAQQSWLQFSPGWPGSSAINQLVRLAAGLFIFAATIVRYVSDNVQSAEKSLNLFLQERGNAGRPDGVLLEKLYSQVLDQTREYVDWSTLSATLSTIAELGEPLAPDTLGLLIGVEEAELRWQLHGLHSVLRIPITNEVPIRFFHTSFRDFLQSPSERRANKYRVDRAPVHSRLARECLRQLNQPGALKQDICALRVFGVRRASIQHQRITDYIPAGVAYACNYWVWHMAHSVEKLYDEGPVHRFLNTHFLHWLEALSWLGRLLTAIAYINELQRLVSVS